MQWSWVFGATSGGVVVWGGLEVVCFFDGLVSACVWDDLGVLAMAAVVLMLMVVVSQLLQVLSHFPGTALHCECFNIVWHCLNDNLLCLFAHRPTVLVVVVVVEVVVVVVSQSLQVLAHCSKNSSQTLAAKKSLQVFKGNVFFFW